MLRCHRKKGFPSMRQSFFIAVASFALIVPLSTYAVECPPDSVAVGPICIDKYEASVWNIASTQEKLIRRVQRGRANAADLTNGGATPHGITADDYSSASCPDTGNGCTRVYAVSILGVSPSRFLTWFQAAAACRNAGKRLLTNAEWQTAAFGTPDPGVGGNGITTCNTGAPNVLPTGSAASCVSDVGAFDMVGNLWEWVADWIQGDSNPFAPQTNGTTNATYGNDLMSGTNPAQTQGEGQTFPAALERGGSFGYGNGTAAGVFALSAAQAPSATFSDLGFRCGR